MAVLILRLPGQLRLTCYRNETDRLGHVKDAMVATFKQLVDEDYDLDHYGGVYGNGFGGYGGYGAGYGGYGHAPGYYGNSYVSFGLF